MLKKILSMMLVMVSLMLFCQTIAMAAQLKENIVEPQYTYICGYQR